MNFLDPFEIYYRDDADLKISMLGSVHLVSNDGAMQALVKQEFGLFRQLLPGRKRTRSLAKTLRFLGIMHVVARATCALLAVLAEHRLELFKEIGLRAEMAEVGVVFFSFPIGRLFHPGAIVSMESITLDESRGNSFAPENLLKSPPH